MYRCRYLRLRRYVYNMYYRYILLLYVYIRSTTIALFDQNMYVCVCINTQCESERPSTSEDRVRPSRGRGVGGWGRGGVEGGGVTSRRHSYAALEGAIRPWNAVDLFPARLHTHKHTHSHTHSYSRRIPRDQVRDQVPTIQYLNTHIQT